MPKSVDRVVDGIKYTVVQGASDLPGYDRWDLRRWVPTFGTGGAWHQDARVYLAPDVSSAEKAAERLLGPEQHSVNQETVATAPQS